MPLYEYQCDACGERFEAIQKFSDPLVEQCRKCGKGPVQRLLSSPAIQFKGSGWYITDYAKKSGSDSTATGKSEKSDTSEKKSDSATDSKPAAASTPAPSAPAKSDSSS